MLIPLSMKEFILIGDKKPCQLKAFSTFHIAALSTMILSRAAMSFYFLLHRIYFLSSGNFDLILNYDADVTVFIAGPMSS